MPPTLESHQIRMPRTTDSDITKGTEFHFAQHYTKMRQIKVQTVTKTGTLKLGSVRVAACDSALDFNEAITTGSRERASLHQNQIAAQGA
jgi:hypothetical protein